MAMINQADQTTITCWANVAEGTRTRPAFKWVRVDPEWAKGKTAETISAQGWRHRKKPDGVWHRVRVLADNGRPLFDKIPQSAHHGTPLTGLTPANLKLFVKVLNKYGDEPNVKIAQGPTHDLGADNSYERYMIGTKGYGEGWILAGSCPVLEAMGGRLQEHLIVSESVRSDYEAGHACHARDLGIKNPPCPHYEAEQDARMARRQADYDMLIQNQKSDETKLLEGNVAVQKDTASALTAAVQGLVGAVKEIRDERAPTKGGGK